MKTTEAQKKASLKYQSTLKQLNFRIKESEYNKIQEAAQNAGQSMRAYVLSAVSDRMEQDKAITEQERDGQAGTE